MPQAKLQVIRRARFKTTPWKNGGGVTHEAFRAPEIGDPFRWRVSVADVETSGPFSDFGGYSRTMVLLKGEGIDLRFGDGTHKTLRKAGEIAEFDGAMPTHGELLRGPCVDLNLMVSTSDKATARVEHFIESVTVRAGHDETVVAFPLDRRITMQVTGGDAVTLEPWDLAVLRHGAATIRRLEAAQSSVSSAVFIATLKLVGGQ